MSLRGAKRRGNLPEGNHFKSHARYFCTRGENEHTSKRVSVIACDNVISKAKLSGTPRDTVYSRGKGVCEHKTTDCRLRQSVGQKRSIRRVAGALHIRAKVPYGHRTPKLCFGFSAAHRRHKKKTTKTVVFFYGAGGRTRTGTVSLPVDFESTTSANSITPAQIAKS